MKESIISAPQFHNEESAYEFVEAMLWPDGPVCPHCGCVENIGKLKGKSTRPGLYKCYNCRKPFTVKIGTIFEDSHVPLRLWLQAIYLISSSKKGFSANQLSRTLGVTLKTAWFMGHRIRLAMEVEYPEMMKGIIEADECYVGGKGKGLGKKHCGRGTLKAPVVALVERGGRVKSQHVDRVTSANLKGIIRENVETTSTIMTDDFYLYRGLNKEFYAHKVINHSKKIYSKPGGIHTNTIEGYFSILKRGIIGVYQHVDKKHLSRYLAEFDFRYNLRTAIGVSDTERAEKLLKGVVGKRITYETAH
jgi:transposase-like protein